MLLVGGLTVSSLNGDDTACVSFRLSCTAIPVMGEGRGFVSFGLPPWYSFVSFVCNFCFFYGGILDLPC